MPPTENGASSYSVHRRSATSPESPRRSATSAMKSQQGERSTTIRRRGSIGGSNALNTHDEQWDEDGEDVKGIHEKGKGKARATRHVRSLAEESKSNHHPLDGPQHPANNTRPHLARLLSALENAFVTPEPVEPPRRARQVVKEPVERVVLVHTITATDSLAGISLRYGISLAELRKANKLWANDSIHLRKILHIPLDKASKAADFMDTPSPAPEEPPDHEQWAHEAVDAAWSEAIDHPPEEPTSPAPKSTMSTIRRIPASQMSFFPPASSSSKSSLSSIPSSSRNTTMYNTITTAPSRHSRAATSPITSSWGTGTISKGNTYTSLLTALPDVLASFARQHQQHLPVPTQSRPSFEAARSFERRTPSFDSSRSDTAASDEHELHDVGKGSPYHVKTMNGYSNNKSRATRAAIPSFAGSPPATKSNGPSSGSIPLATRSTHLRSSSYTAGTYRDEAPEDPKGRDARVRTVQMAPSPAMQVPKSPPII